MKSEINMIVATSKNKAIGLHNKLPWHLPGDLAYFQRTTSGQAIIMGRKTYESIGRPLPNRHNIVLTHQKDFQPEGVTVVHTIEEALKVCAQQEKVFVIGGGEIYKLFLPYATHLYITQVDLVIEGDTFFPDYEDAFKLTSTTAGNNPDGPAYNFTVWSRI